ncbi:hypothetical protein H1P_3300002 [Hyella patelloides LEGE 07179]|uniref:Uncharacterized protein n=1 Tax=Hyella patelloides LEGE 07179 TaxID=945734 RepID=A0A563VVW1_9CYAN|nr:hypothetical protein [Hyella patelloides]VEP15393.1 hypothetical protein H1P_3300002 [Hyella patelloides LEGE 07179]
MKIVEAKKDNRLSSRQLNKMRTIIENRWDEVWQVVVERDRYFKELHHHQHNSDF